MDSEKDRLGFILCNCCHFCFNHCECDNNCPVEREFEECQPKECRMCIEFND